MDNDCQYSNTKDDTEPNFRGNIRAMALTDEQRGPRAAWLRRHRKARFGSGDGGLAKLSSVLGERGLYRSPVTIKGWEASDERSPIPAEMLPALEEIFGEPAPRPRPVTGSAELVAAVWAQVEAINQLLERLDALAPGMVELLADRVRQEAKSPRASSAGSR